jgi:hypothetical protein
VTEASTTPIVPVQGAPFVFDAPYTNPIYAVDPG